MTDFEPAPSPTAPLPPETGEFTRLLHAASAGDREAFDAAFASAYRELRALAARVRASGASDTLSASALVHEAYLKLAPSADRAWADRRHFFALAARAMRQVLIGAARERLADKRGGGDIAVTLEEGALAAPYQAGELVALDESLHRLAALNERQARVVELRFFAGLTVEEIAETLGVATPTVQRDWRAARAWLARDLGGSPA
jgi:RNA polymerase sigma factor (TIGR02999 family)